MEGIAEKQAEKKGDSAKGTSSALTKGNLTIGLAGAVVGCKENKPTGRNL